MNSTDIAVCRLNDFKKKDRQEYLVLIFDKRKEESQIARFNAVFKALWHRVTNEDSRLQFAEGDVAYVINALTCVYFAELLSFLKEATGFVESLKGNDWQDGQAEFIHGLIWGVMDSMCDAYGELEEKINKDLEEAVANFIIDMIYRQAQLKIGFACLSDFEVMLDRYMRPGSMWSRNPSKKQRDLQEFRYHRLNDALIERRPFPPMNAPAKRTALQISTRLFAAVDFNIQVASLWSAVIENPHSFRQGD